MGLFLILVVFVGLPWPYYALMESSEKQGTLGKMLCGLKVTTLSGDRLTFAHATGRYFSKILSETMSLGYLLAVFTPANRPCMI